MNTKLTLTVERDVIAKAKRYARSKNSSVSDLVETYLRALTSKDIKEEIELTPTVKSLLGSFKAPEELDYKKVLREEIQKKHG